MGAKLLSGSYRDSSYRYEADKLMYKTMLKAIKENYSWWNPWYWIYLRLAKLCYQLVLDWGASGAFRFREKGAVVTLDLLREEAHHRTHSPLWACCVSKENHA